MKIVTSCLIDSGPIIALFNNKDRFHKKLIDFISSFDGRLLTTWPVITESMHLLSSTSVQLKLLEWIDRGGLQIVDLSIRDIKYIKNRISKYSDLPMDLADASLMCVAERDKLLKIISVDSDFSIYRTLTGKFLKNLLPL